MMPILFRPINPLRLIYFSLLLLTPNTVHAGEVGFTTDVMAVLSKAGCNQGICHGNQNGKNGFKLSLRGQEPAADLVALTRDTQGRRLNRERPTDSLILLKATATVPHEGGRRFTTESLEYAILRQWLDKGAPSDASDSPKLTGLEVEPTEQVLIEPLERLALRVWATFADGKRRDVTRLAVFEPSIPLVTVSAEGEVRRQQLGEVVVLVRYLDRQVPVRLAFVPARPGYVWPVLPAAPVVDEPVYAKLRSLRMLPSAPSTDSVFLRRVYLDLIGLLPTADEARAFLADGREDKRERVVDQLLDRPEFADFWALKWSDVLRNEDKVLDRKGSQEFHRWLRDGIAQRKPLNEIARELLASRGSTYQNPAANFYRALRDPYARSETAAQVFLGLRLQCARCHNHPFDRWTQDDYHSLAAFFARVQYRIVENNRRDRLDTHEFDGEQIVWHARAGELKLPRSSQAAAPRFLDQSESTLAAGDDRVQAFADWIANPDNPFFARAQANRIWHHLFGRGIVEPNDDFRSSNPPSNGPLLDALARYLREHNFDLRALVRLIVLSHTYQASSRPNDTNREDEANFARCLIRPLQAEQLVDGVAQVLGQPAKFGGYPLGTRAGQLPGVVTPRGRGERLSPGEQFLRTFGKPERLLACECERTGDTTLAQALQMISGEMVNQLLARPKNRIGTMLEAGATDAAMLDEFFLAALSRYPTAGERQATLELLGKCGNRRAAWEDVVWGLVNAKEFLLRQ